MKNIESYTMGRKRVFYKPNRIVQKTGNSFTISIPKQYIREWKIVAGQEMKVVQDVDGNLVYMVGEPPHPYLKQFSKKKKHKYITEDEE